MPARSSIFGQASFERFFTLACQFGFAEEARRRGLVPVLLYLMSPDRRSVEAYGCLCRRLPEAMLAPVYNEIFGVAHYGNKYADRQRYGHRATPITYGERAQICREVSRLPIPKPPRSMLTPISSCNTGCNKSIVSSGTFDQRILLAAQRHTAIQQS
jgi:hypothetical protein